MSFEKPDGRKPTTTETKYYLEMVAQMKELQDAMHQHWFTLSIPEDWHGMDDYDPVAPRSARVTLNLDEAVAKWYRRMGPGYQKRINQVLAIYMYGIMSGAVERRYYEQAPLSIFPPEGYKEKG
jgi:uncharacterized protein (DUF4415 family)